MSSLCHQWEAMPQALYLSSLLQQSLPFRKVPKCQPIMAFKCYLWAPNFGVSGPWSWRVFWWPYSCRKRRLGSRRGTPLADSPVLPSVVSIYWGAGRQVPQVCCRHLFLLLLFLRKGTRLKTNSVYVCVSTCFLPPLRSTRCWLIVMKVNSESFYAHITPPCPIVLMSPYIGPGLVTLCDKTKENGCWQLLEVGMTIPTAGGNEKMAFLHSCERRWRNPLLHEQ